MLLIRADASTAMGTGHVMRCLALAQAWQETGGRAALVAAALPPALSERLASEGVELHRVVVEAGSLADARATAELARNVGARWVVVDGYQFGADYQRALKDAGLRVLFVDDYGHAGSYCADLVLNQNSYANEGLYAEQSPHTRLLLGPRYVLLRREFWPWRGRRRDATSEARKILVTLGGADPDNVTLRVIQALDLIDTPGLEAMVIAGGGNPHYDELREAAARSRHQISVERNVADMPALMARADVAVSAGGSTCYELAFMGLPPLMIVLADNQRGVAADLAARQVGRDLGWHEHLDAQRLSYSLEQILTDAKAFSELREHGQGLVDGWGGARVVAALQNSPLTLRHAIEGDSRLLWSWVNEPGVRSASFQTAPIPWADHVAWFGQKLSDPRCSIFIALNNVGVPVGQARFDGRGADEAEIDVSVGPQHRGLGYGSIIIRQATVRFAKESGTRTVHAFVRSDNIASRQAFLRAGYQQAEEATYQGVACVHFVWRMI